MLLTDILNLILLGIFLFFLAALIAPFESLGWWAGWFSSREQSDIDEPDYLLETETVQPPEAQRPSNNYVVFLDGISRASREDNVYRTGDFITALNNHLFDTTIISDIFPYSPQGKALTDKRLLSYFWILLDDSNKKHFWHRFRSLINLRNLLQVLVSSDRRYGPIFNQGAAATVADALLAAGYPVNSGQKIHLIGYSGGAQIAVGIAPYLKETLGAPLEFISFGGVFMGDKNLNAFETIQHVLGSKDTTSRRSLIFFPHRWWLFRNSSWNRLRRAGIIQIVPLPSVTHNGKGSYFDRQGNTHLDTSLAYVKDFIDN